jgi:hemerythrin-like domain-containing protein
LRRALPGPEGPVRQMLHEHDRERSLVEGIEDALFTKKGADFIQLSCRLIELLRDHIRKEDNILFEIVERSLSPQQDDIVVAQLNRFEIPPQALEDLRALEWKYMRRVA